MDSGQRDRAERGVAADMARACGAHHPELRARILGWYAADRRRVLGLSVDAAAAAAGIDPAEWSTIELGGGRGAAPVAQVAEAFQVDPAMLTDCLQAAALPASTRQLSTADMVDRANTEIHSWIEATMGAVALVDVGAAVGGDARSDEHHVIDVARRSRPSWTPPGHFRRWIDKSRAGH